MYVENGTKASLRGGIAVLLLSGIAAVIHSLGVLDVVALAPETFVFGLVLRGAAMAVLGAGLLMVALPWLPRAGVGRSEPLILAEPVIVRAEH